MSKLIKPRKLHEADKSLDYSLIQEYSNPQIGDSNLEYWEMYRKMAAKTPISLSKEYGLKLKLSETNLRKLDSSLDGDWYYILRDIFGEFIQKYRPGLTQFISNLNNKEQNANLRKIAHVLCGPNNINLSPVRLSSCLKENGLEIQIPTKEVDNFEFSNFYFFENNGLFLVFNTQKFLKLDNTKKWLSMGQQTEDSPKSFANTHFNVRWLMKFGCIDHYGYCNGTEIYKDTTYIPHDFHFTSSGNRRVKYPTFKTTWLRGCNTSLKRDKYAAFYISGNPEIKQIFKSQSIPGLMEFFFNKEGEHLTKQALAKQARVNTENFLKGEIPQKLSIVYDKFKQPHFLMNIEGTRINEEKLKFYLLDLYKDLDFRTCSNNLEIFLKQYSVEQKRIITKKSMTVNDYFNFINSHYYSLEFDYEDELLKRIDTEEYKRRSNKENNYYKSEIAYNSNRKLGFITKSEIQQLKIRILSGDNFLGTDYYLNFLRIKRDCLRPEEQRNYDNNHLKEFRNVFLGKSLFNDYKYSIIYEQKLLDKNIFFSNLKGIGRNVNNIDEKPDKFG
jgi:hypothetical protein